MFWEMIWDKHGIDSTGSNLYLERINVYWNKNMFYGEGGVV
jgi:hypothetical protein